MINKLFLRFIALWPLQTQLVHFFFLTLYVYNEPRENLIRVYLSSQVKCLLHFRSTFFKSSITTFDLILKTGFINRFCQQVLSTGFVNRFCQQVLSTCFNFVQNKNFTNLEVKDNNNNKDMCRTALHALAVKNVKISIPLYDL